MGALGGTTPRIASVRTAALAALWAASVVMMTAGTIVGIGRSWEVRGPWFAWGIYLALIAAVPTGWWIVDAQCRRNAMRVEHLAKIMAAEAAAYYADDGSVTPIR